MCPCLTPGPFSLSQASHLLTTPPGAWIGGSPRPVLLASLQQSAVSWVLCESSFVWSSVLSFLSPLINVSEKAFDLEWMYLWASSEKFYGVTQRFPMLWRIRGIFQIWFWAESNLFQSVICCQAVSSMECEACDERRLAFLYLILTTVSKPVYFPDYIQELNLRSKHTLSAMTGSGSEVRQEIDGTRSTQLGESAFSVENW